MGRTSHLKHAAAIACVALLTATCGLAQRPEPEVHGTFDGEPMYSLLPPDAIPAITEPEYVGGLEAEAQMAADEAIIGVADGDDAVCWSAWHLDHHEIVNDTLAGTAIAATW